MQAKNQATVMTTEQLKAACLAHLASALQAGEAEQHTASITQALGSDVAGHRVRYVLEQLVAAGSVVRGRAGRTVVWTLAGAEAQAVLDSMHQEAIEAEAVEDYPGQHQPSHASIDQHVAAAVDAAANDLAEAAMANDLGTVLAAKKPAKKRSRKAKAKKTVTPEQVAERKAAAQADKDSRLVAEVKAAATQADALRAAGIEDRIMTRMAGSKGRKVAKLARLLGVPSAERAGFKVVVRAMQADGRLTGDDKIVRPGAPAPANPEAVALAITTALGEGAAYVGEHEYVTVTGPALGALAAALGLDPATGAKARKVRATEAAGTWAMLGKGGVVKDSRTKAKLGTWSETDSGLVAQVEGVGQVRGDTRAALRDAVNAALAAAA